MPDTNDVAAYARAVAKHAVERRGEIDYTQTIARWSGINQVRDFPRLPPHADCSSFTTWVFWTSRRHVRGHAGVDVVNNLRWQAGYTGTQINHGARHKNNRPGLWKAGRTLVFYGGPSNGSDPSHVALWVDDLIWNEHLGSLADLHARGIETKEINGHLRCLDVVVSHGSDAGPKLEAWDYRPPVQARAYPI